MEQLTAQQKANRAYYALNAEKIKAKKRAEHALKKGQAPKKVKPVTPKKSNKPTPEQQFSINSVKRSKPVQNRLNVSAEDLARLEARRRIEDRKLAKELGLDSF